MNNDFITHVGDADCLERLPVMEFTGFGKAYVPYQTLCQLYIAEYGFGRGTIFPELDLPYEGGAK